MNKLTYCGLSCDGCGFVESHGCAGCKESCGKPFHGECPVAKCAMEKGVEHCGECPQFPCEQLYEYSVLDKEHGDGGERIRRLAMLRPGPLLDTSKITQVGLVVNDINASKKAWATFFGVPEPEASLTDTYDKTLAEFHGARCDARSQLAFFNAGQVQIELIQPDHEPSTWREELDKRGDSLHHVAFVIKDMKKMTRLLDAFGIKLTQRGEYVGGRYAYFDALEQLGLIIELLEND